MILLNLSKSKLPWYIAPMLPFLAVGFIDLYQKLPQFFLKKTYSFFIIIIALGHQLYNEWRIHQDPVFEAIENHIQDIKEASQICYLDPLNQQYRLMLSWHSQNLRPIGVGKRIDKPMKANFLIQRECLYFQYE
jgi:hypothetical protein